VRFRHLVPLSYTELVTGSCSIGGCPKPVLARGWCSKHYHRWNRHGDPHYQRLTYEERVWSKVIKSEKGACWIWNSTLDGGGYGIIRTSGGDGRYVKAHRAVYELAVGRIPDGLQLDHLCKMRRCVNPEHLEPVTAQINTLRSDSPSARNAAKDSCKHGHVFTDDNTYVTPQGWRQCRTCLRSARRRYYSKAA
jgi:hypothetical protein